MFTPIGYYAAAGGGGSIVTANLLQWMDVVGAGGTESSALTDSSGNGNNLTNNNVPWDGTNSWFYFSSNTDWQKYIDTGFRPVNDYGAVSWTVDIWMNISSTINAGGGYSGVFHNRSGTYGNNFIELAVGETGGVVGKFSNVLIDNAGGEATAGDTSEHDSVWNMVSFVHNTSTSQMEIYVDGVLTGNGSASGIGNVNRAENPSLFGNFLRSDRYFQNAKFGSYRFYTAAHTATECAQNFNAEKSHFGL